MGKGASFPFYFVNFFVLYFVMSAYSFYNEKCNKDFKPSSYQREGTGTPLQHSCLENPLDGRAW